MGSGTNQMFIYILYTCNNNSFKISMLISYLQINLLNCEMRFSHDIHWTQVISSHHAIFAPVQKVKIPLTKFKFNKKVQGFVETLLSVI